MILGQIDYSIHRHQVQYALQIYLNQIMHLFLLNIFYRTLIDIFLFIASQILSEYIMKNELNKKFKKYKLSIEKLVILINS
jgi:hypothetical protein